MRTDNLWKVFEHDDIRVEAVRGVTFQIDPGEFVVLAGPSGSGKTTLLNLIGGLTRPTDGQVWVDGTRDREPPRSGAREAPPGAGGIRVPGLQPVARAHGARERRIHSAAAGRADRGTARGSRSCSSGSGSPDSKTGFPGSCLEDSSSVWPWLGRWSASQPWSRGRTDRQSRHGDERFTDRPDGRTQPELGTTFVFATHDPLLMERARVTWRLVDGSIVADERRD